MFKVETNIQLFVGLKVELLTGKIGTIDGSFGQSGKFKVGVKSGLSDKAKSLLSNNMPFYFISTAFFAQAVFLKISHS